MKFDKRELVRPARRDRNPKRSYLLVNPLQGKHVPVAPVQALELFDVLCTQVQAQLSDQEPVLVIAFAETATAIGAALATGLKRTVWLIQTTREAVPDTDFLYFSETHSHATEQRLANRNLADVLAQVRHVIFAEDEVTTGNTILHLMDTLCAQYQTDHIRFGVASILNGMKAADQQRYQQLGLWTCYIIKTDQTALEQQALTFQGNGICQPMQITYDLQVDTLDVSDGCDMRTVCTAAQYQQAVQTLAARVAAIQRPSDQRVLVLGTEELMYAGLRVGQALAQQGKTVFFHATTRSPILPDDAPDYPLHVRWELRSVYDDTRVTYLYDLQAYDHVYLVTEHWAGGRGLDTILSALERAGNRHVTVVKWRTR